MTTPDPTTQPAGLADDTGDGLLILIVVTAAVLISTAAVAFIALVGTWWALGFGFAVHLVVTTVVMLTTLQVMAGRAQAISDRAPRAADGRREGQPQAHIKPVAAL